MTDREKLNQWADKLLDTGKRNNLINFKDKKSSSAEVVYPECETLFSKCFVGKSFELYDPKIPDDDVDEADAGSDTEIIEYKGLSRDEYLDLYAPRVRGDKYLLVYSRMPNPLTAVKNIAKKAKELQDETGINAAYLAFGFVRWNEKENSEISMP